MTYLLGIVLTLILFSAFYFFTEIALKQKLTVFGSFTILILSAIYFNNLETIKRDKISNIVILFQQGKNIQCNTTEVNSSNFTLSVGTFTFIRKRKTPYFGQMFSLSKCEIN